MSGRNETAARTRGSLRDAVERACADLPAQRRKQVAEDLLAHLDELPDEEADRVLHDVAGYVREMREAWGLEIVDGQPARRRRLIATVVAVVLVAAGAGAGIGVWASSGSGSAAGKDAVVVPTLFGLTQDKATALLTSVGLNASISYQPRPDALGTVLSQQPDEGVKVRPHSGVVVDVAAPIDGPLWTALPARPVPLTQIAAINTDSSVVLYYAAIAVDGPPVRPRNPFVTVGGITALIPSVPFTNSGICKAVSVFTATGGTGGGGCTDPRQLARITYTYTGGYICGLTSLPAASVRISFTGTPGVVTVATRTSSQFSGLRFFIAKPADLSTTNAPPSASIAALDNNGKILLSLTAPPS